MTKTLGVVAGVLAMVGCVSSNKERQETPGTDAATSTTAPQATSTGPAGPAREQATADLASTKARLQEAQREQEAARSEGSAADAETRSAQSQMDSANRLTDSVAQARAAEFARAAEKHRRSAMTHQDYADKLVAARQADIDAAEAHVRTVEAGGGVAASTSGSNPTNQRLADAQSAEEAARQRAAELGQAALAAQRAWEDASHRARASTGPADAATSGTGSGVTDTGAAFPTTPSAPAPTGR